MFRVPTADLSHPFRPFGPGPRLRAAASLSFQSWGSMAQYPILLDLSHAIPHNGRQSSERSAMRSLASTNIEEQSCSYQVNESLLLDSVDAEQQTRSWILSPIWQAPRARLCCITSGKCNVQYLRDTFNPLNPFSPYHASLLVCIHANPNHSLSNCVPAERSHLDNTKK
jgi:hypothetical protein